MTDQALDMLMRRVLIDALRKEEEKHWYSVKLQGKNESICESIKIKTIRLNLKEKEELFWNTHPKQLI